jgi:hypothetical protein
MFVARPHEVVSGSELYMVQEYQLLQYFTGTVYAN